MMRLNKYILLLLLCVGNVYAFKAKTKHVELKEFTSFKLYLSPDLGTRLVFPFILDAPELDPTFKLDLTNSMFEVTRLSDDSQKNQNTMLVNVRRSQEGGKIPFFIGTLFMSVDGYNITIRLETTNKPSKVVDNVVFDFVGKKREYLIERAIKERLESIKQGLKSEMMIKDRDAENKVLSKFGLMAIGKSKKSNIKEEKKLLTDSGDEILLHIDKVFSYQHYHVLKVDVENRSTNTLVLNDMQIKYEKDGVEMSIDSVFECRTSSIHAGSDTECAVTTRNKAFIKSFKSTLMVSTNRGQVEVSW